MSSIQPTPFWLVWNENGHPSKYRHASREGAWLEAIRLAKLSPGETFYVLRPVTAVKKADLEITTYTDN